MKRTISMMTPAFSEEIAPGVVHASLHKGGLDGPNGELQFDTPGGQSWSGVLYLGTPEDDFQMMIPDIRMPANQIWPLHWHDCWTAVLVLEGTCAIGDWWMKEGDVFLTVPSLEYGPMVIGPHGCRLLEVFADADLAAGGYAPEYRDHPTLALSAGRVFTERSQLNRRNEGRQVMPCDAPDIWTGHLEPGVPWNLGETGDIDRGIMRLDRLAAGGLLPADRAGDWQARFVLKGTIEVEGRTLAKDEYIMTAPLRDTPVMTAGPDGADLLYLARSARTA